MFDNDQMTESAELRALRDSVNAVAMPERPPLEAIMARGRAHRRHRRSGVAGLFVAGAAAGAALTVALVGGGDTGHGTIRTLTPGANRTPGTIRTASYTLVSDTSGKVKLTINPKRLFEAARLQGDLARYGIPAKVTDGRFCTSDPEPAGLSRVVSMGIGRRQTITFDPAAIPAGTELSFGHFRLKLPGTQLAEVALIDTTSYRCTSTVPTDRSGSDGGRLGYFRIPPGPATSHG